MNNRYEKYCTGCGLCAAFNKAKLQKGNKGFIYPIEADSTWLKKICPASGNQNQWMDGSIWGHYNSVQFGWSSDESLRAKASSGGALTEIASFMLEKRIVDSIIHTCVSATNPTGTQACLSTTRDELKARCGSRYSISHPLEIINKLDLTKRYAFIGKPCDVIALRNFLNLSKEYRNVIVYTLSFFCAGLPSDAAQDKLLKELGCNRNDCKCVVYRGNGWPGFATATDENGNEYKMDYDSSWGKILGRDIMPACRFCIDGIGETADIACCDGWYLNKDKTPDFSEHEGRNIIFARTDVGSKLLQQVISEGNLIIEDFPGFESDMAYIQHFQRERRETMLAKRVAMNIMFKPFPRYAWGNLLRYYHGSEFKYSWWTFKGTIKRILLGKIW